MIEEIEEIFKDHFKKTENDCKKEDFDTFSKMKEYEIGKKEHRIELYIPPPKTPSGKIQYFNKDCELFFYVECPPKKEAPMTCPYCGISSHESQFVSEENQINALERACFAFYQDCLKITRKFFQKRIYQFLYSNNVKMKKAVLEMKKIYNSLTFTMPVFQKAFLLHFVKPNNKYSSSLLVTFNFEACIEEKYIDKIEKLKFKDIKKKLNVGSYYYFKNPEEGPPYFYSAIINKVKIPSKEILPIREDLLRNVKCPNCSTSYSICDVAFFCPICGIYNLKHHFKREKELIKKQLRGAEKQKREDKEYAYRLFGNVHEDVLTTFETYLKKIFFILSKEKNNIIDKDQEYLLFQNTDNIKKYYKKFGLYPLECLNNKEKQKLDLYIQERHLFGHNLGMIDNRFRNKNHTQKRSKQNILLINSKKILDFFSICEKVICFLSDEIEQKTLIKKKFVNSHSPVKLDLLRDDGERILKLLKKSKCFKV